MGCVVFSLAIITTTATVAFVVVQADAWYRQLLRSHEMMQQLVGGADPSSPLDADWDTASVTSTEQNDQTDDKPSGWAAGQGLFTACPYLSLCPCLSCVTNHGIGSWQFTFCDAHMLVSRCQPAKYHCSLALSSIGKVVQS